MGSVFKSYSHYYDLLYKDKDYDKETKYIQSILNNHNISKGSLLEFGSGTGIHGKLLAKNDYKVHGIELSEEMVAKAGTSPGFSCQIGDISSIKMNLFYDAVLSLFHVISYQITNDKLKAVFENASSHLNRGGLFLFDFWYSPAVLKQKPVVRVKRMANNKVEITRIAEPEIFSSENRVDVNYTIYVHDLTKDTIHAFKETHSMRHFSLSEIDILADACGFQRIKAEEFVTGHLPSDNTWGVCAVLKKI